MASLVLVSVVIVTSAGTLLIARRRAAPARMPLSAALIRALDCLGWAAIFFMVNAAVGAALILGFRAATGQFVSVYVLADVTLVFLSVMQALVLQGSAPRQR